MILWAMASLNLAIDLNSLWDSWQSHFSENRLIGQRFHMESHHVCLYPLVNVDITMENHHLSWLSQRTQWPFSIAIPVVPAGSHSSQHKSSNLRWLCYPFESAEGCRPLSAPASPKLKNGSRFWFDFTSFPIFTWELFFALNGQSCRWNVMKWFFVCVGLYPVGLLSDIIPVKQTSCRNSYG